MLIDKWNIAEAGGRQWKVVHSPSDTSNNSVWDTGVISPALIGSQIGGKTLKITLQVKGTSRQMIENNISDIIAHLLEPCELTLDGFTHTFYGVGMKFSSSEFKQEKSHRLTFDFLCFELAGEVKGQTERTDSLTLTNAGNIPCPLILTITPTIGLGKLHISGVFQEPFSKFDRGFTISNLVAGQPVTIDGDTGIVKNGDVLADAEFYQFPILQPGKNVITFSTDFINVDYQYRPRFL